jgi:sulfite reductase (NADPH) hemoprotein beta-component
MAKELSRNEHLKAGSRQLRGTLSEGLDFEPSGAITEDDQQLVKFHGMYLQDDRDLRGERSRKKLEKAFGFMVRVRIPGGVCNPEQWLAMDYIGRTYGNGTMRLTTRETFQFHGIIKSNARSTIRKLDSVLLNSIAACGDINRNVLAASNPHQSRAHAMAYGLCKAVSDHLLPKTRAYREIWIENEKVAGGEGELVEEPLYGKAYLPRKFKVVVAVPPSNDIDVFAHDLGFIAILDDRGDLQGWNVTIGGGMGMTHGEPKTYPRTGDLVGYCKPDDALKVAEAVMTIQRDWGDRSNRAHARLKYTVEDYGLDAWRKEIDKRAGITLEDPKPFVFTHTGDRYGWTEGEDGRHHLTLFIENGRIKDHSDGGPQLMTGLREIAKIHDGEFRMTANQNVIIANISKENRPAIEKLVAEHGLTWEASALRRNAMACVALPTCGLALAESERYLPTLVTALEERLEAHGLSDKDIVIRMTGCPNGCARPYLAEIGLVGKGPGRYNLYLGAAFNGSRMSKLYAEDLDHDGIVHTLDPLFGAYARRRHDDEHFSDFVIRMGYVVATTNGPDFHVNTGAQKSAAIS